MAPILVEDPVTMFESAVLLSFGTRMRTDGVAAALQSGGACTLFAEAAGAQGLSLPEFSAATKRKLRKALPHYASQNNPLDVTGQAAVETEMFCRALDALAHDPAVGFVAFDAFPPREEGEDVWADPVLRSRPTAAEGDRASCSRRSRWAPLGYGAAGKRFVAGARLPFLQGHRAGAGAIRALVELQGSRSRSVPELPPHPNRGKALRLVRGMSGPLDEARAGVLLELYGVRRPAQRAAASPAAAATAARAIGFPVAVKALAPELPHKAKLGGVRLGLTNPTDVEVAAAEVLQAARRAGAAAPRVLVQRMATGTEVLVGAVVDGSFGACITMRPGGALAEAGAAAFAAAPLTRAQALAFVRAQAGACALSEDRHDLRAVARAVEAIARAAHDLRGRLTSLEANPLLVSERGAIAVDALAEAGPPGVIYGLVAALGFGLADFEGAIAGRRIGSLWTVIFGQTLSAAVMTVVFLATDAHLSILGPVIGFVVLNGIAAAAAYQTHYRALELGPVAVVSPIGSAYAVVGVLLAVIFLGERPGVTALVGTIVTVIGVALVSTDLREFRAGVRGVARGVPWALVSTVTFGVAGFLLGYLSQQAGWVAGLWASRTAQVICYIPLAFIARKQLPQIRDRRGLLFALIAALADIVGVIGLSVGSERGYVSVTLAASAVFPLVAVVLSLADPARAAGAEPVRGHRAGGRRPADAGRLVCDGLLCVRREELHRDAVGIARRQHVAVARIDQLAVLHAAARSGAVPTPRPRRGPRTRSRGGRARRAVRRSGRPACPRAPSG